MAKWQITTEAPDRALTVQPEIFDDGGDIAALYQKIHDMNAVAEYRSVAALPAPEAP